MALATGGCSIIVIDTLNRTLHGSESKDEDMGAYHEAADRLRVQFKCSVILVHHCGIDDTRPRGHTSLTGAVDTQLAVKRNADGIIIVTLEWMKDGPEGLELASRLVPVKVGQDTRGKAITSCVVEHLEVPASSEQSKKGRKLSAPQKLALELLREAVAKGGEVPPESGHIPKERPCVSEEVWRQYCYKGGISAGATHEAKRAAFTRAAGSLPANGQVGKWGDWVWPA